MRQRFLQASDGEGDGGDCDGDGDCCGGGDCDGDGDGAL